LIKFLDVLVVDDDLEMGVALNRFLTLQGYAVRTATSGEEGLTLCQQEMPALVLLDLNLPGIDGLETLRQIRVMGGNCHVVMVTAYDTARAAVEAMRMGAADYVTKPVPMEELRALVVKLIGEPALHEIQRGKGLDEIVGKSESIHQVFDLIRRIARTSSTVLVTGESGTGKELVARAIHANSDRASRPFLSINCASIPANLLESELFGHEKGAFTDAKAKKLGLVEVADDGTLFLDEIGLMPLDIQAKLLTVLETRSFRRLGATDERTASARFIAATNRDLEKAVKEGGFREDLYYRLNVIPIRLPPLRERGEDILLLARYFLSEYTRRHETATRPMTPAAESLLRSYPWSGNVRELKNVIERAVLLTDGPVIDASDLSIDRRSRNREPGMGAGTDVPVEVSQTGLVRVVFPPWGLPLEELERQVIEEALNHTKGNISQAAKLLHISRDTLRYRLQKHGIGPAPEES
jgi:two-component system response regulator AtoC